MVEFLPAASKAGAPLRETMSASQTSETEQQHAPRPAALWTLRLWGFADARLDVAATVVTVLVLLWTRFAFLASGPWEWDETLFARGILRFDIRAHFPHPPGFPLWLALGWLVKPFVSEPLRGLQLLSALFSVLTLWPLSALARRMAPERVAMAATLVFLMLPGVWLHAPRGFSATPAAFFALWAAAVAVDGLTGRRVTAFTVLITASFLIRPIILPSLGLLWIAGALTVRPRKRLLPGVAIGAGAVVAATVAMVLIQGKWSSFVEAFGDHATRHARGLAANVAGFSGLGITKGSGGEWVSVSLLVLAALGLVVWARRRGTRFAAAWAAVWLVGVAQLVWLQDRAYPRYAVPFQLAAAPLVAAGAAAAAPPAVAAWGLAAIGAYLSVRTYPLMVEQRDTLMPAWAALRFAAETANRSGYDLVVEPGLAPFTSYLQEVDKDHGRPWRAKTHLAPTPSTVKTLPTTRYLVVTDKPDRYLPPITGRSWLFAGQSVELGPLTQGRFHRALVLENPTLPVSGWQTVFRDERKVPFVWGGTQARLLLPPFPAGTSVALEVEPTPGATSVELQVNGVTAAVFAGSAGRRTIWLSPGALVPGRTNELAFTRPEGYPQRVGGKPYGLRVSGLRIAGGSLPWNGSVLDTQALGRLGAEIESASAEPAGVTLAGTYARERFPYGWATWTAPTARLRAPARAGVLSLLAWAPRPDPAQLEVWLDGALFAGPLSLPNAPTQVQLFLDREAPGPGVMDVELRSVPFTPQPRPGQPVRVPLGIVLADIEFDPLGDSPKAEWRGRIDETRGWVFDSAASGTYDPETFEGTVAAWSKPRVTIQVPGGPGTVELTVLAPRPTAPHLEVWAGGRLLAGPFDPPPSPTTTVAIPIPSDLPLANGLELELRCVPFVPARAGGRDTRALGVVVSRIAFIPAAAAR
jgi:hypothetical protein